MAGYVKLHRKLINWEWYTDGNVARVFIHLLLLAQWQDKSFRGINLKAGQIITSYEHIAKDLNLSISQVRTAIEKLVRTHEVEKIRQGNSILLTIEKWGLYQVEDENLRQTFDRPLTDLRQTFDNIQEVKEIKESKKYYSLPTEEPKGEVVKYSDIEWI